MCHLPGCGGSIWDVDRAAHCLWMWAVSVLTIGEHCTRRGSVCVCVRACVCLCVCVCVRAGPFYPSHLGPFNFLSSSTYSKIASTSGSYDFLSVAASEGNSRLAWSDHSVYAVLNHTLMYCTHREGSLGSPFPKTATRWEYIVCTVGPSRPQPWQTRDYSLVNKYVIPNIAINRPYLARIRPQWIKDASL